MPDRDSLARLSRISIESSRGELQIFLRRLAVLVTALAAVLAAGTLGFVLTDDVTPWRGFYWSLDTITTIGSVADPQDTGGEVVKVALIVFGIGTLGFFLVTVTEFFVAGHLTGVLDERRTLRRIENLRNHHVICGFGRVGRQVARDMQANDDPYVVVDSLPENRELAQQMGAPFLLGTPSDDEMLREAGIERARAVLACVDSDSENIFICLTARELRSDITIVARAAAEDSEKKLLRAGADRVISPYKTSGAEMARLAVQPQVSGVVDVAPEYRMEEIEVIAGCEGVGQRIGEVRGTAVIAALRRSAGDVQPQPALETKLQVGDVLVAMGTVDSLKRLEALFAPVR